MKLNFTNFGRKWQFAVMAASGFLPAALIAAQKLTPENPWPAVWVAAAYAVLALLTTILPGKRRLPLGLLGAAALMALGFAILDWRTSFFVLIVPGMYAVLLIVGLPVGGLTREDSLPAFFTMGGLAVHVLAQIVVFFNENTNSAPLGPIYTGLNVSFLVYALMGLLTLNRLSLTVAAAKGHPAPAAVRRRNLLMTLAMGAITLAIACLPELIAFIERAARAALHGLVRLVLWLSSLLSRDSTTESSIVPDSSDMFIAEPQEPGMLAAILEKLLYVLVAVIGTAFLIFVLRMLWRKLKILIALLMKRLSRFAASASEDYEDEISDTREDGERTRLGFLRRRKVIDPLKGVDESALAPGERIRFHYLKLMLRRPDWTPDRTARENLPEETAELYEKARYSDHEIDAKDAEAFLNRTRKI